MRLRAHAIDKWFPDQRRTLPTAILSQGSAFGVILAVPALNWVIVDHLLHYAFGALGVVGLIWVGACGRIPVRKGRSVESTTTALPRLGTSPRFPASRCSRTSSSGCCAATFGAYRALSLGLDLVHALHRQGPGLLADVCRVYLDPARWVFGAVIVMLTGWLSQVLLARGVTTRGARGRAPACR